MGRAAEQLIQQGKALGRAEGRAEGEAKGRAEGILKVLDARGLAVTDEQRQRILTCSDLTLLDRWLRRAVTATSADELFTVDQ